MNLTFTENRAQIDKMKEALEALRSTTVEVGLPGSAPGRSRWLLALHERGAPGAHIPPRPVVQPALAQEGLRAEMGEKLLASCEAAFQGDLSGARAGLEEAGQRGADGIREYIDAGISPPNSPVTLSGGWIYNRVAKKGVMVKGKAGDKPMLDTGALYNDFDYEITEK